MNEKLLQYLWKYKIFKNFNFKDTEGNALEILDFGTWNYNAGPDFLHAKIKTGGLILAGHIELHLRSSDWIFHKHSGNPEYQNIILHAVYQHDADLEEFVNSGIPTLELYSYIDEKTVQQYQYLLNESKFIPCEKIFSPEKVPFQFAEENLLKKLDQKSLEIEESLKKFKNDYEAVLFHRLAYAFGLKVNAQIFKQIAENIDFTVVKKNLQNQVRLEALLLGMAGWLKQSQDAQTTIWKREFDFIQHKYQLADVNIHPKFMRLRPPNFPTIRLSQLAHLYHREQNLFSKIIAAKSLKEIIAVFSGIKASEYWDSRYSFGKISGNPSEKYLSQSFIELILINAVLPVKYTYHKYHHENIADEILEIYSKIKGETNTVTQGWQELGVHLRSALESQAYLYHYHYFCEPKNCLHCSIGYQLLH